MSNSLAISLGQHSDKGRKETNQDFHGACIPKEPQLSAKGIVIALADGISSSRVSRTASEVAVKSFLEDYYCTSDAWSVKQSAQRVLTAANSWLHSQTQQSRYRFDRDRGYVCTLSAMVIKSTTAHIFHVGDTRIYRVHEDALEQLTNDHRVWVSHTQSQLSRALGVDHQLEIDYQAVPLEKGDVFLFASDGVYEFVGADFVASAVRAHANDLDTAAKVIVADAYLRGSADNLTIQIVRIDDLPDPDAGEAYQKLTELPFPPILQARMYFEGYRIIREVHASHRSHVYLALDDDTKTCVILKTPSIDCRDDPAYLEGFLMEEWVAQRIDSPFVSRPCARTRKRQHLYLVTEFIDGQTLTQWMIHNPKPDLETVRAIVEQVAKGLLAFHRLEMLHQDLRPDNVMVAGNGGVKIIDFGSTRVAGIMDIATPIERQNLLGTAPYTAPEYFLGESGTTRSDMFSLGVIAYQMLSGKLPYGTEVPKARTRAAQRKLVYRSLLDDDRELPAWIDEVLCKAVHPDPAKRYEDLSEFTYELRRPRQIDPPKTRPERKRAVFWRRVSFVIALIVAALLIKYR